MKRLPWLWATAGVLGMYFAVRYALMPPALDDAIFFSQALNNTAADIRVLDWSQLLNIFNVGSWAPRLSNVVVPLMLSIPVWLKGAIGGVLQAATLVLGARMAGLTRRNSLVLCTLMAVMYIALLPWYDSMTVCAFMTNYCIPTALMMGLYTMFVRERPVAWWNAMLYAIFFAFWHEGFTACTMCACWFTLALHRRMWRTDRLVTTLILTIAMSLYWEMPATHIRLGEEMPRYCGSLIFAAIGIELFIAMWLVCAVRRKWHHVIASPSPTLLLGTSIAAYAVMWILRISARSAFPGMTCAVFGLLYIINRLTADRHAGRIMKCSVGAVWLGLLVQFGYVVHYDYINFTESEYIMKEFARDPDRQIFAPLQSLKTHPAWTLRQNYTYMWIPDSYTRWTNSLFLFNTQKYINVVPVELQGYSEGFGIHVESNTALERCATLWYVCRAEALSNERREHSVELTFGNGFKYRSTAYAEPFRGGDGVEYIWVYPNGSWLEAICGTIVRIDFDIE